MAKTKEELIHLIKRHDYLYYIEAEPEITDSAYDALSREYRTHDPEFEDFQPGLNVPVPKKKKSAKRTLRTTYKKPALPTGRYREPDSGFREFVVFGSDDWTVFYWDVYHTDDGPRIQKRYASRVGWEADMIRGVLVYDNQP